MKNPKPISGHQMIRRYCRTWTTAMQWAQKGFGVKISSRISEMIANGETVQKRWSTTSTGKRIMQYRFIPTKKK